MRRTVRRIVSRTARRTVRRLVAVVVVVAVALVAIRIDARLFSPRASPTMPLFHRKLKARWSWPPCAECTTLDRSSTYAEQPLTCNGGAGTEKGDSTRHG